MKKWSWIERWKTIEVLARRILSDQLLSSLSTIIAVRLGLHFPENRWDDLERGVTTAAQELGFPHAEAFARRLLSAALTQAEIQVLAGHMVVGETYFFREQNAFDALQTQILPEFVLSRRNGGRRLRIWSAGCCTGEEPYSIAMLLDRCVPDPTWDVTILATDINPQFLRKAMAGVYSEWSFRNTPEWIKDRYFKKRHDGDFELSPRIRSRVTFSYLNLAEDVYPSLLNNTNAMDVIFCRNTLMYFAESKARGTVENFYRSLVDGGCLIVSPTETSAALFPQFSAAQIAGGWVYRKISDAGARSDAGSGSTFASPPIAETYQRGTLIAASEPVVAETPDSYEQDDPWLAPDPLPPLESDLVLRKKHNDGNLASATARDCANQGRLTEAIGWCGKAIAADKQNPAHYYLLGIVEHEQGHVEAARKSLTRALYLDPRFVLAHFSLGNIELSQGRRSRAERHFKNALAMLQRLAPDATVPEAEGLIAERLSETITAVLASLPRAGATRARGGSTV